MATPGTEGLEEFINAGEKIVVSTIDGRFFEGVLAGYDQMSNIVLESCCERIVSPTRDVTRLKSVSLGTTVIRGDNVMLIGAIDLDSVEGMALGPMIRPIPKALEPSNISSATKKPASKLNGKSV